MERKKKVTSTKRIARTKAKASRQEGRAGVKAIKTQAKADKRKAKGKEPVKQAAPIKPYKSKARTATKNIGKTTEISKAMSKRSGGSPRSGIKNRVYRRGTKK